MNRHMAIAIAVGAAFVGSAYAQAQPQPPPIGTTTQGTNTPGTVNPAATDPSTATPGTVSPPAASGSSSPAAASSPHQREVTGPVDAQEANPSTGPGNGANPSDASSPHQRATTAKDRSSSSDKTRMANASAIAAGMRVRSTDGQPVGVVKDIVPTASGAPGYVLIAPGSGGRIAVPYATVSAMTQDGKIVLDGARVKSAPRVQQSQLLDASNTQWQRQADQYWNGGDAVQR